MILPSTLLPADLAEHAFIAGGFAACPALASDIDVWVPLRGDRAVLDSERLRVLEHLKEYQARGCFTVEEQDGWGSKRERFSSTRSNERDTFVVSTFEDYHLTLFLRRVGKIEGLGALPYHIILVLGDVDEVLSSFDISTHQCALTTRGFIRGIHWTALNEEPVVLTHKYTTEERLRKIADRYAAFR